MNEQAMPIPSIFEVSTPLPPREGLGVGPLGLLSSAYLAPVHYYTKLYSSAQAGVPVIEEQADHYVKQTYRNRCIIAGDDGPIALTIPVSAPAPTPPAPRAGGAKCLVSDSISTEVVTSPPARGAGGVSKTPMHSVLISSHGSWRHQHWQAIVSAYSSSPFFEYYADDFYRVFHAPHTRLVEFNAALRDLVLDCLDLHPQIIVNTERYITLGESINDYRETIRPKIPYTFDPTFRPVAYWQVFASRHGFLPNLSIIDLLFNMGPESRLVLRDSIV